MTTPPDAPVMVPRAAALLLVQSLQRLANSRNMMSPLSRLLEDYVQHLEADDLRDMADLASTFGFLDLERRLRAMVEPVRTFGGVPVTLIGKTEYE